MRMEREGKVKFLMSKAKNIVLCTRLIWKEAEGCKLIRMLKPLVCK